MKDRSDYPAHLWATSRSHELKKTQGQSNSEFVANKSGLCDIWLASRHIESYTELRELLNLQDIKNGLPVSLSN